MKTTPREGDYFQTDVITDDEYVAMTEVFISAGCPRGERHISRHTYLYAGWEYPLSPQCVGFLRSDSAASYRGRKLSLSDLLGDDEAVWNGIGVPPAGTECTFQTPEKLWIPCKILFVGEKIGVIKWGHNEKAFNLHDLHFRPLKSERELAIEEMTKFLQTPKIADTTLAEDLYDFGFRIIKDAEK